MKNKNFKIILLVVIIIAVIISAYMLFFRNDYSNVTIDTKTMMNNIMSSIGGNLPSTRDLDEQEVKDMYNLDMSKIDNYAIKAPIMNIRANEIAIIKVKNGYDVSYVKDKINERIAKIKNTFEKYLSDQYELAKNPLIIVKGKYILMAICDDNDGIENSFNKFFNASKNEEIKNNK